MFYKVFILLFLTSPCYAQEIFVSGAMRNVMRKGELQPTINLDTLKNKQHLYGIGPNDYLKGELLILDGISYLSYINEKGEITTKETYQVKAPFFVYGYQKDWQEITIPKNIKNSYDLENHIDSITKNNKRPFVFKLEGKFDRIDFHIQNLPDGTIVKSPEDAHKGQGKYTRKKVKGEIVGFFSTEHKTIFTHHDSFVHLHFINAERTEMGHIDALKLNKNIKLFLPK